MVYVLFFFFKQKTAYEMRISDWSSDVCSSDLVAGDGARGLRRVRQGHGIDVVGIGEPGLLAGNRAHAHALLDRMRAVLDDAVLHRPEIGRASCRERVCQYV